MISFIVIGYNEEKKIYNCINSIYKLISHNKIIKYEILYIDSDSSDESIEVVRNFPNVKIFKIVGDSNAAIARNVGANLSYYNVLFFIDGDMEINENFELGYAIEVVMQKNTAITGRVIERLIDNNNIIISERVRKYPKKVYGGIFIIPKKLFHNLKGMDEKFRKGQDYDFFIRLNSMKQTLVVMNTIICFHYTVGYRLKIRLIDHYIIHSKYRALLLKKHAFNLISISILIREYYPNIIFLAILLLQILMLPNIFITIFFTIFIFPILSIKKSNTQIYSILLEFVKPIFLIINLIFFSPPKPKYKLISL